MVVDSRDAVLVTDVVLMSDVVFKNGVVTSSLVCIVTLDLMKISAVVLSLATKAVTASGVDSEVVILADDVTSLYVECTLAPDGNDDIAVYLSLVYVYMYDVVGSGSDVGEVSTSTRSVSTQQSIVKISLTISTLAHDQHSNLNCAVCSCEFTYNFPDAQLTLTCNCDLTVTTLSVIHGERDGLCVDDACVASKSLRHFSATQQHIKANIVVTCHATIRAEHHRKARTKHVC